MNPIKNFLLPWLNKENESIGSLPNNPTAKLEQVSSANTPDGGFLETKAPMAPIPRMSQIPLKPMSQNPVLLWGQRSIAPMSVAPKQESWNQIFQPFQFPKFDTLTPPSFQDFQTNPKQTADPLMSQAPNYKPFLNIPTAQQQQAENDAVYKQNWINILKQYKSVGDFIADVYKGGWMEDEEIERLYPEFKGKTEQAKGVMTEVYDALANNQTPDFLGMKERYKELFTANLQEVPHKNLQTPEQYQEKDKKSETIWEKMKDVDTSLLSANGQKFWWMMQNLNELPKTLRGQYKVPEGITDTEITSYIFKNNKELQNEFNTLAKIPLTDYDKAQLGIWGNWMNRFQAWLQKGVNKANQWFQANFWEDFDKDLKNVEATFGGWAKVLTVPTKALAGVVGGLVHGVDKANTALAKLGNWEFSSKSEIIWAGAKGIAGGLETTFNTAFAPVTAAFNAANETETGKKITKNTLGLFDEGIDNILNSIPKIKEGYQSMDEEARADLRMGLTTLLLHKTNQATKNTQFNAKMMLGVAKDAIGNAIQKGRDASRFQVWIEKGLADVKTGEFQKGALGRIAKEGAKELSSSLKENFWKFNEVLKNRRQQVNTLTDQRDFVAKVKDDIQPGVDVVKKWANKVAEATVQGVKIVGEGIQQAGQKVSERVNKVAETTKNIVGDIKNPFKKGEKTETNSDFSPSTNWIQNVVDRVTSWVQKPFDYVADKIAEWITSTASAQDKLFRAQNPSLNRLWRKDKSYEQKRARADRANELIVERGHLPKNAEERMTAHKETMQALWEENIGKWLKEKANVMIDANEIANAMEKEIAHYGEWTLLSVHEGDYKKAMQDIANLRKKGQISIADAENYKQQINMAVDWNNNPTAGEVYQKALRGATKKIGEIEDKIIGEIPGEFTQFKRDYGALKDGMEDVIKAYLKEAKKNGMGIMETYGRFEGLWDIMTAFTSGKTHQILPGIGKVLLWKAYGRAKNVDFLIERGFKQLAKEHKQRTGKLETQKFPALPKPKATVIGKNWPQVQSPISPAPKIKNKEVIEIDKRPQNIIGLKTTKKTWNSENTEYTKDGKKETTQPIVRLSTESEPTQGTSFFTKEKKINADKKHLKWEWDLEYLERINKKKWNIIWLTLKKDTSPLENSKPNVVWLFDTKELKPAKQRDGLNPEALPLSDYKAMQKLDPFIWALKKNDFKDYITAKLTADIEEDRYLEVHDNIEDMLYSLEHETKAEANKYAERIIPWKTADEIVSEYTKEYNSDLQLLKELDKKYPEFYNWKLNLGTVNKQKTTTTPEKPKKVLWSLPESLKKREAFETLPSDVDFLEESKKAWPKRIAPDRKAHQQLDPQTALEKLAEQEKTRLTWKIKELKEDLATLDKLVKKYGEKMPARTEKNRQKYPDLLKDYSQMQQLRTRYQSNSADWVRDIIKRIIDNNTHNLGKLTPEDMKKEYIALVQEDISKGYKYPEAVLDFVPEARKILNGRERYEKGLYTSFSAKDERINYEYKEKLGAGMKRQDGKELTQEQKQDIVDGVEDFWDILGLNMKKLWEEKNWVYVHLNGKNVFLKNGVAGLYREKGGNISISVGGTESVRQTIGGEVWAVKIHPTMAHELGHALDGIQNWKLFPSSKLFDLKIKMNKAPNWNTRYWKSDSEVTARAIEQYVAIKKGNTDYYDKPAYWKKEAYESIIEPMVKEGIGEKFAGYMKWGEHSKPLPKTTQDSENAMIWVSDKTSKKMHELSEKYPSAGKNELDKIGKLNSGIKKSSGKRSEKDKEIYRVKDDILLDDIIEKGISIKDEWENTTYTLEQDGVYVTRHLWDRVRRILKQKWLLK